MHGLPITAAVREVLALLQLRLHQGTADTGVAVSVHPVAEPCARNADLSGVAALHHPVVSVAPFLHCFHDVRLSTPVLLLVSRRRQRGMKKAGSSRPPHPSFFFGCHASESAALRAETLVTTFHKCAYDSR